MRRTYQLAELLAHAGQDAQAVVLGQRLQEVLDGLALHAGGLLELGDDGALVGGGQRRRGQDGRQLGVLLQQAVEAGEGLGGGLEGGGLDGRGVL